MQQFIKCTFLVTFLDANSLMMVSLSISSKNHFSMHNVAKPFRPRLVTYGKLNSYYVEYLDTCMKY